MGIQYANGRLMAIRVRQNYLGQLYQHIFRKPPVDVPKYVLKISQNLTLEKSQNRNDETPKSSLS